MNEINAIGFSRIEILEITNIDVVTDPVFEDESAFYPCTVKWLPIGETPYLGKAKEGVIKVLSNLKCAIIPGTYTLESPGSYVRATA